MVLLFNRNWDKSELARRIGNMDQLAGIRLSELIDGKGRGCRVFDVWTGSGLRFQVNADRALDVSSCEYKGLPIAWRSAAGDVNPAFYEPQGLGWLRSFSGGLLATCGLDQFGLPGMDVGLEFGLHGRISNVPATQVSYRTFWYDDEYNLEITGESRQSSLFSENIVLRRCITTSLGSNRIVIEDSVTNEGFQTIPHMILYHFNIGFPLVDESTKLQINSKRTISRDTNTQCGLNEWNQFHSPVPDYKEQVFIHCPEPDENGIALIELINSQIGLSLRWSYRTEELPFLMEWKMMGEGEYVVGIEPANCNGLAGRKAIREQGLLPVLKPGENRNYHLELDVIGK